MRRLSVLLLALCAAVLAGCANADLARYYTPESREMFPRTEQVALVDGGQDAEAAYKSLYQGRGYLRIGRLSFVGPWEDDSPFLDYAKSVGADVVVLSRRYATSRVVDNDRGGDYGMGPQMQNLYGGIEAQFDPSFAPGMQPPVRDSYVVREYRQTAIFLRRTAG
jgi:hypothetical protein